MQNPAISCCNMDSVAGKNIWELHLLSETYFVGTDEIRAPFCRMSQEKQTNPNANRVRETQVREEKW